MRAGTMEECRYFFVGYPRTLTGRKINYLIGRELQPFFTSKSVGFGGVS